jgi:hypothetical protein
VVFPAPAHICCRKKNSAFFHMISSCYVLHRLFLLPFPWAAILLRQSLQRRLAACVSTICDDVTIVAFNGTWSVIVKVSGAWNFFIISIEWQEMLTSFDWSDVSERHIIFVVDKVIKIRNSVDKKW